MSLATVRVTGVLAVLAGILSRALALAMIGVLVVAGMNAVVMSMGVGEGTFIFCPKEGKI